jgi:hypothetical protein
LQFKADTSCLYCYIQENCSCHLRFALQIDPRQKTNVLLYHSKRKDHVTMASSLAAYSIVITSYTMLANECGSIVTSKGSSELIDLASDEESGMSTCITAVSVHSHPLVQRADMSCRASHAAS